MKLSLLLISFSAVFAAVSAYGYGSFGLAKRDHGLPYSTLPSTSCTAPSACSSISGTVNCRCNDAIIVCVNDNNQYCWGSSTLTSSSCPTIPTSCSSSLTGSSSSCLCNSNNVLCVDNANNYCYGSISSGTVSITAIPNAAAAASSSSSAISSAIASSSIVPVNASISASSSIAASSPIVSVNASIAVTSSALSATPTSAIIVGVSTLNAPSNVVTTSAIPSTSGSSQINAKTMFTLLTCIMVAYINN
ncbi:hypothetical protein G6F46_002381 [Rhizopus delemar]|uniref:Secreted protein n=3 Tax=Rhizopus TaxID=4842 RepID=I1BMZ5_RHIO9|nr:hypothetical protein RO3G_02279 [Rhizopus delemar RA 99-880]KAG1464703.1 hypothetical protein G6F55_001605 [Rhizopus delemar]KAG1550349.1 hypothetical protein G6F51_002503 [Rhizopus arrhizus]KAG1503255.1 hypothetical protein G6F54_001794 [Rhizopus delemar]KAG1518401.1 hypothetical protein G6F53_000619 [Rhizopus delemar]|eukprot:EIE77575.1 hypothetical protein RO3G_02279 [Rhizopus delemar RA 99-880]